MTRFGKRYLIHRIRNQKRKGLEDYKNSFIFAALFR